ncbi:MAG: O-antigen ligase family protein [Alphaproteobacteria bacterium]
MIFFLAAISLLFSFTNFIYLSASLAILSMALLPFSLAVGFFRRQYMPVYAFIAFFIVMAAVYDINSLIDPEFYRRDGNIFVSLSPLLTLLSFPSALVTQERLKKLVLGLIGVALLINIPLFALWAITGKGPSFNEGSFAIDDTQRFASMFFAYNAAGGFFAIVACFTIGWLKERKTTFRMIALALIMVFLFSTASRGSIMGLGAALCLFLFFKRYQYNFYKIMLPAIMLTFGIAATNLAFQERQQIEYTTDLVSTVGVGTSDLSTKEANIFIRTHFLWPAAFNYFLQSPIVGIGFGAFDDRPVRLHKLIPYALSFNEQEKIQHTDSHAHNSYLHILCETGIVGLGIFLSFLAFILRKIRELPESMIKNGLFLAFWTLSFASLTEHRWVSPSNAIPFFIILGLAIGKAVIVKKSQESKKDEETYKLNLAMIPAE